MTTRSKHGFAEQATWNERAGITARRILVAGEGWEDDYAFRRRPVLDECDAVVWSVSNLDKRAVADAIGGAARGKLYATGDLSAAPAGPDFSLSYLGDGVSLEDAAELAAFHRSHGTRTWWLAFGSRALQILRRSESPVEARFAVAATPKFECEWDFDAQVQVGKYRVDFTVTNDGEVEYSGGKVKPCRIAIEIDGHEWHERTKEQASRDKARDRAIQADGWRVFRFTGSEVWNNAHQCVAEVIDVFRKSEQEWMDA